jgi:hypothetical protein
MRSSGPVAQCSLVGLVVLAAAACCCRADDGAQPDNHIVTSRPQETMLFEFDVLAGDRLYLYGERVCHVRLTMSPADSLRLNGIPIYPTAQRPIPWEHVPTDEERVSWYADVPYVQALLASGVGPGKTWRMFERERYRILDRLHAVYAEARRGGESVQAAGKQAFAQLRDIDKEGLVDWDREPAVADNYIKLAWKGIKFAHVETLSDVVPVREAPRPPQPMPTEDDRRARATEIHEALALREPCWCFIGLAGFRLLCGEEMASRLQAELDQVLATGDVKGVSAMHEYTAREILEKHKINDGLPN